MANSHTQAQQSPRPATHAQDTAALALGAVTDAISRLRFGAIALTVHDGRVVQLEVTERQRFS